MNSNAVVPAPMAVEIASFIDCSFIKITWEFLRLSADICPKEFTPVLSVNGTDASPEDRPVLSVDQTEENLFEKDKPVLFDPSVPPAEQSLLEQREGVSGETVLDEGAAPESEPSRGNELEQQKK